MARPPLATRTRTQVYHPHPTASTHPQHCWRGVSFSTTFDPPEELAGNHRFIFLNMPLGQHAGDRRHEIDGGIACQQFDDPISGHDVCAERHEPDAQHSAHSRHAQVGNSDSMRRSLRRRVANGLSLPG
jgi:hypothetical protein